MPALLTMAHWNGTLAAVRELGRRGIEVHVASSMALSPASWSCYASRTLRCPSERSLEAHATWLLEEGQRAPGRALLATSDDACFLHALRAGELTPSYRISTLGLDALREVLDKGRLNRHAEKAGLRVPSTRLFAGIEDTATRSAELAWPQLIKSRSQAYHSGHKGTPVKNAGDLRRADEEFRKRSSFAAQVLSVWPGIDRPMLQEYLPGASGSIYCLSGFIASGGRHFATRAARKVLSQPRFLGIGLCFEHAEVHAELEASLIRMCREVGFHGMFQCEFLEHDGQRLLIDFNPRFYNFMCFDQARGLPQAYLAYLDAIGEQDLLIQELERARLVPEGALGMVYHHRFAALVQLGLERVMGLIPGDEVRRWRSVLSEATRIIDPVWDPEDPDPAVADVAQRSWNALRHPRAFIRQNAARPF